MKKTPLADQTLKGTNPHTRPHVQNLGTHKKAAYTTSYANVQMYKKLTRCEKVQTSFHGNFDTQ